MNVDSLYPAARVVFTHCALIQLKSAEHGLAPSLVEDPRGDDAPDKHPEADGVAAISRTGPPFFFVTHPPVPTPVWFTSLPSPDRHP